jgi:hypothetical protein
MEEPPPLLESKSKVEPPHATSLPARLLNVFAVPSEVFAEVKASRVRVGNWLVPAVLSALVAVFAAVLMVSQSAFQRQIHDLTDRQTKLVDQQVKAGKVKPAEASQILTFSRVFSKPSTLKILASMGAGVIGFACVFWWAFILWILDLRFLKVRFGYAKALEVTGLALMINVLGTLVTLLLMVNLPSLFATSNLASAIIDLEASLKSPLLQICAYVFAFWLVGVLSVGLAKLAGVPFLRAAWLVFAAWLIQKSLFGLVLGALGQSTL